MRSELAEKTRQVIDDADDILTNWSGSIDSMTWTPQNDQEPADEMLANSLKTWTHAGLTCAIRECGAHLCGYVRVPMDHPARRRSYQSVSNAVTVHGGLTYGEDGWFGFDTAHGNDSWSIEELTRAGVEITDSIRDLAEFRQRYAVTSWTVDELVEETNKLAAQLADLTMIPRPDAIGITEEELEDIYFELDNLKLENRQLRRCLEEPNS